MWNPHVLLGLFKQKIGNIMIWARADLNRRPTGYEPVAPPV
jgi:hypothetical protein